MNPEAEQLTNRVQDAIASKKIFEIDSFHPMFEFPLLRNELLNRGWVQKVSLEDVPAMCTKLNCPLAEMNHTAALLKDTKPNFIFTWGNDYRDSNHPYVNRLITRNTLSDNAHELQIAQSLQSQHNSTKTLKQRYVVPRCYSMSDDKERFAFKQDFRLTICRNFLYALSKHENLQDVFQEDGKQTSDCLNFALDKIKNKLTNDGNNYQEQEFSHPLLYKNYNFAYQDIMSGNEKMKILDPYLPPTYYVEQVKDLVKAVGKDFPHMQYEGDQNIWVVKSSEQDNGFYTQLFNDEEQLFDYIDEQMDHMEWIVQKYIERPLLIHKTRFFYHQYFMITMCHRNINMWMYDNYLFKFADEEFTLNDLSATVHFSNVNAEEDDTLSVKYSRVGSYIWSLPDFQAYLLEATDTEMWPYFIKQGMIACVSDIANKILEDAEFAENHYQIFSAEFTVTEDYSPVLMDIQLNPNLNFSDKAHTSANVNFVQDIMKVVLDYPRNKNFSTGDFQLMWQRKIDNKDQVEVDKKEMKQEVEEDEVSARVKENEIKMESESWIKEEAQETEILVLRFEKDETKVKLDMQETKPTEEKEEAQENDILRFEAEESEVKLDKEETEAIEEKVKAQEREAEEKIEAEQQNRGKPNLLFDEETGPVISSAKPSEKSLIPSTKTSKRSIIAPATSSSTQPPIISEPQKQLNDLAQTLAEAKLKNFRATNKLSEERFFNTEPVYQFVPVEIKGRAEKSLKPKSKTDMISEIANAKAKKSTSSILRRKFIPSTPPKYSIQALLVSNTNLPNTSNMGKMSSEKLLNNFFITNRNYILDKIAPATRSTAESKKEKPPAAGKSWKGADPLSAIKGQKPCRKCSFRNNARQYGSLYSAITSSRNLQTTMAKNYLCNCADKNLWNFL